jgi:hypothetical protein
MQRPSTPPKVRAWADSLPDWITVRAPLSLDLTLNVHRGEQEAISLALEIGASLILLDDRAARMVAVQRGLRVTGLLAIVETAGERNLLSLPDTLNELGRNRLTHATGGIWSPRSSTNSQRDRQLPPEVGSDCRKSRR